MGVELLLYASESGELEPYMFSLEKVQQYITSEISGSSFKLFRAVCISFLKLKTKLYITDAECEELFNALPKGFVSVGAYILRKERNLAR